ncbi:MAG: hypothetical protein JWM07_123, partial [Candidatus Saccharibacteria bacterium]|nr:hypothetical protein [Candidatus Saccharibacteria bacterium]
GVVFSADQSANVLVVVVLLIASLASLALRWVYILRAPVLSQMFAYSYVIYFVAALLITVLISSGWVATATGVGVMLFLLASYVERQPWIQVVASILTVATLAIVASIIALPQQWVALFTFGIAAALFYVATGLHFAYKQQDRQLVMTSTAQVTLFLIIFAGATGHYVAILTSFIILLVWAVTSLAIRWWCRDRSLPYSQLFLASYPVYYFGTLLLLSSLSTLWSVLAFTVGVIICWVASYAERSPGIIIAGNAFLVVALSIFWWWMDFDGTWMILGITWILAAVFYFGHWILKGLGDDWRSNVLLWSTWIVLVGGSFIQFFIPSQTVAVGATLIALALTLAVEGRRTQQYGMIETAVYVTTFGMQRIAEQLWPELNFVVYAHWWAIVLALVAMMRQLYRRERLIVAMGFVTLSSGLYALMNGGNYQLLFLIEHLALLVVGALLSKSWAIWWGISASALAVLYFLRNYTFLLLGFLGLLLIAIVVWRLMRNSSVVK